jgi:hypothetical protein
MLWKDFLNGFDSDIGYELVKWIIVSASVWVPIVLGFLLVRAWIDWKRADFFFNKNKYVLLEIKLPRETNKSPLAMELFFHNLYQTSGEGTWYARYFQGKTRPWFSLEIVSIEGQVKFHIWTRSDWKNIIEAGLYSQYPDIEVYEVPDYTRSASFDPKTTGLWASDFEFTKPDPLPIKTYVEYGLLKDPKEEFKVDPIAPMIEFLGTVGPNQQVWIQFMIRAHKKEQRAKGSWFKQTDAWKDQAKEEIAKVIKEATLKSEDEKKPSTLNLTDTQKEFIASIERSVSKYAFDTGIRALYICKKESFDKMNISGIIGSFRQYGSEQWNGFKPARWLNGFDFPWQDFKELRQNKIRMLALDAYKRRSYFFPPYQEKPLVLNVEELATMFHFPGSVVRTPTFERVASKKSEAPANLPI